MSNRVLILGNGLSAATLSNTLVENGVEVTVQAKDYLGGLCEGKFLEDGVEVHVYGPHIFRTDDLEIWKWIHKFADWVPYINTPMAMTNGRYYNLPINMNTFQQVFGISCSEEAKKKLEEERVFTENPKNAEEAALSVIGKTFYEMFIEEYTVKQWKKHPRDLPAGILARLPIRFEYNNNYYGGKKFQGLPLEGYTKFIKNIFKGANLTQRDLRRDKKNQIIELNKQYDKIFICEAPDTVFGNSEGSIPYLATVFGPSKVKQELPVVNLSSSIYVETRSVNYGLLWPYRRGGDCVMTEIPVGPARYDEENLGHGQYSKRCYPAHDLTVYNKYKKLCDTLNISLVGRMATNSYLDMEDAITAAKKTAIDYLKSKENI